MRRSYTGRGVAVLIAMVAFSVLGAVPDTTGTGASTDGFDDVPADAFYSAAVSSLATRGVFEGTECTTRKLCPDAPLDRKTMAVWIVRVIDKADPAPLSQTRFTTDVPASSFHAPFIERMAELEITFGCNPNDRARFCPNRIVTRSQMAAFLTRAYNLPPTADPPTFTDVDADAWYAQDVARLAASGITQGCGDGTRFCPKKNVTRGQMAAFLHRAESGLQEVIDAPPDTYTALAAGERHSCAIRTDRSIVCWGSNEAGETDAPPGTYTALAAGERHSCAIRTDPGIADRTIVCWGPNLIEEEGASGRTDAPSGSYTAVAAGERHSCAIRTDRGIVCWGSETDFDGTYLDRTNPPSGSYTAVAAGGRHSCAIRADRGIVCWGSNIGFEVNHAGQAVAPSGAYTAVAAGGRHSCAIHTDGSIRCWGSNEYGQTNPPSGAYTAVAAGGRHSCAIHTDGSIRCWGSNEYGQTNPPSGAYTAVAAGGRHSCAIHTDGSIRCWGFDIGPLDETQDDEETTARDALVALYNATNGPNWANNTNWLSDRPLGEWHGVDTDADGRVTTLSLAQNRLIGTIPSVLGDLSYLGRLDLGNDGGGCGNEGCEPSSPTANRLSGQIPSRLGNLTNLWYLDLAFNRLSGEIPADLGNLTNLGYLYLGYNRLSGQIPSELGNLTNLQYLSLSWNELSGRIPIRLGNLTNLRELILGNNRLGGQIPSRLGNLTNLFNLWLRSNRLSGQVPSELGRLTNLGSLILSDNPNLSGPLPGSFTDLTSLFQLYVGGTGLCAPTHAAFQSWLAGVADGVVNCSQDVTDRPGEGVAVTMARGNWSTGYMQAAIYAALLGELGYEVNDPADFELGPSIAYVAMASGEFDFWVNSWYPDHNSWLAAEMPDGSLVSDHVSPIGWEMPTGGLQGLMTNKRLADEYEIRTLDQIVNDPELFAIYDAGDSTPDDGVLQVLGCPEGWGCRGDIDAWFETAGWTSIEQVQVGSYEAQIAEAISRDAKGIPYIVYTWAPSAYAADLRAGDNSVWLSTSDTSISPRQVEGPATLGPGQCSGDPCNLGWDAADIRATANNDFLEANPAAAQLLELITISPVDVSLQHAAYSLGEDTEEDVRNHAAEWIANNRTTVDRWLDDAARAG